MKQLLKQKAQNIALAKKKAAASAAATQQAAEGVAVEVPAVVVSPPGKKARVAIAPALSDPAVEAPIETPSAPVDSEVVAMEADTTVAAASAPVAAAPVVAESAAPVVVDLSVEMAADPVPLSLEVPVAVVVAPDAKKIGSGNPFSSAAAVVAKTPVGFGAAASVSIFRSLNFYLTDIFLQITEHWSTIRPERCARSVRRGRRQVPRTALRQGGDALRSSRVGADGARVHR